MNENFDHCFDFWIDNLKTHYKEKSRLDRFLCNIGWHYYDNTIRDTHPISPSGWYSHGIKLCRNTLTHGVF